MKKSSKKLIGILIVILLACIYYYVTIPAINIHSSEFWIFIILLIVALLVYYIWKRRLGKDEIKQSKVVKGILFVLLGVVLIYGVGTLLSSPIVNAKKYQKLLTVKDGEFTKDIEELSFDQIPLLDKDSATILGNRKMGSMVDMVSQFEVDDIYTQYFSDMLQGKLSIEEGVEQLSKSWRSQGGEEILEAVNAEYQKTKAKQ